MVDKVKGLRKWPGKYVKWEMMPGVSGQVRTIAAVLIVNVVEPEDCHKAHHGQFSAE